MLDLHTPSDFSWKVEQVSRNVHNIRVAIDRAPEGWELPVLCTSDWHWDNPHCLRDKLRSHLDEALRLNAPIIIYGDLFCAMQGKFDKRSNKDDIRPEHAHGDYLDALVRTCADWLDPYKHIIAVIGPGNHESAVRKNHETDLIERLVERLRMAGSTTVHSGGFSGYVRIMVCRQRCSGSIRLHYHHGYGGGGPVTRGVIQTARRAVYVADADICCGGHVHEEWVVPITRIRLKDSGQIRHDRQWHICTPGYKEEYIDGFDGFHIERGRPPKPTGSAWVRLSGNAKTNDIAINAMLTT